MGRTSKWTAAFKAKVAVEALKEQQSVAELAKHFDVSPAKVTEWKDEFLKNATQVIKGAAEMGEKTAMFIYGQFVAQKNPAEGVYWLASAFRRGYEPALDYIQKNKDVRL